MCTLVKVLVHARLHSSMLCCVHHPCVRACAGPPPQRSGATAARYPSSLQVASPCAAWPALAKGAVRSGACQPSCRYLGRDLGEHRCACTRHSGPLAGIAAQARARALGRWLEVALSLSTVHMHDVSKIYLHTQIDVHTISCARCWRGCLQVSDAGAVSGMIAGMSHSPFSELQCANDLVRCERQII